MDNRSNNPGNNSYEKKPFTRPDEKTELLEGNMIDRRKVPADGTVFIGDSLQSSQFDEKNDAANNNLKKILIIAIIVLLLIAGFFLGRAIATMTGSSENDQKDEENKGFLSVDPTAVEVINSDWDWDSKVADDLNNRFQVYDIMIVKNNSTEPIVKMDFFATNTQGEEVTNGYEEGKPFTAYGYIKAGEKGVMVADISTDKRFNKKQIPTAGYEIVNVYSNENMDADYEVPSGKIVEYEGGEYYDIMLNNPNSRETSSDSIIVAIYSEDDNIMESDATGRINEPIPAGAMNFRQNKAFYDPNFTTDDEERDLIKIYVIDEAYYDETDEDDS